VTYLVYECTLQAEALALVAAKLRSALLVEGELPEEGLAALEGDGQDVCLALARRLAEQGSGDGESLEALFAQARAVEAEGGDYLVAGSWIGEEALMAGPTPEQRLPDGETPDVRQCGILDESLRELGGANRTSAGGNGRLVSFEELAGLVQRQKSRRTVGLGSQLPLFVPTHLPGPASRIASE
jgi:hypothetical protein